MDLSLDAHRHGERAVLENTDAQNAEGRVEDVLSLDPTRRRLSVQERARPWNEILQRVITAATCCAESGEIENEKLPLESRAFRIEASNRKMEVALRIWRDADASCETDPGLTHIMSKLKKQSTERLHFTQTEEDPHKDLTLVPIDPPLVAFVAASDRH